MARLRRLAIAGWPHHVVQRSLDARTVFADEIDRREILDALREGAALLKIRVHAYVLLDSEWQLLATPPEPDSLSRLMQIVGRRYGASHNRRHARVGALWEGRFRATVIDRGADTLECVRFIEQAPVRTGLVPAPRLWRWSSALGHLGQGRDQLLSETEAFWALGNTPFERELRWARLLEEALPDDRVEMRHRSVESGWPVGSGAFLAQISRLTDRPLVPRPRGRPSRKLEET
jgi:putative transposase